jgi:hypothetical protein
MLFNQVPLPSFETLMNSDSGRLLFAVLIITQLVLVGVCLLFIRSANRSNDRQANSFERMDKRQETFKSEWDEDSLFIRTRLDQLERSQDETKKSNENNNRAMGEMLVESATLHAETRAALETRVAREIANATERVLFQRGQAVLNTVFQFPPADDCRWQLALVKWKYPDRAARIYKAPLYITDGNVLGNIASSGQVVKLISHTLITGWCSIMEILEENAVYGYIDASLVTIEYLPSRESEKDEIPFNRENC